MASTHNEDPLRRELINQLLDLTSGISQKDLEDFSLSLLTKIRSDIGYKFKGASGASTIERLVEVGFPKN